VRAVRASRPHPHPRYGQHFLSDGGASRKILDALAALAGDTVVEIGPGRGALTRPLLARGIRVVAFEIDGALADVLRRELAGSPLTVVTADALRIDVADALADAGATPPVALVGNLPYESATPMIRAFVRRPDLFSRLVVMVQKEVADRLVASPRTPAYGYLTLDAGAHAAARRLFDVRPHAFSPPPRVISTVLELIPRPAAPAVAAALVAASAGFSQRRKTLVNALSPTYGREEAAAAVAAQGLLPTVRAEELSLSDFEALAARLGPPRSARIQPETS
jgi:16S rRNA (adenine1518-N6/adenine1519-N6)-dimethyltransferase